MLFLSGCVWISRNQIVPHANIKLVLNNIDEEQRIINRAEQAILALGYEKQPNDWEDWTFLEPEALERKKLERRYRKGKFEISYTPDLDVVYRSFGTPHLHFYEYDEYVFSEAGFNEYYNIITALKNADLSLGETRENDIKHSREVYTPTIFNSKHNPPSTVDRGKSTLYAIGTVCIYALIILWPGYRIFLKIANSRSISRLSRISLFTVAGAGLLAPVPMPLSMFGPVLLVPLPLLAPMLVGEPAHYYKLVISSMGVTAVISFLVAFKFIKKVK